MFRAKTVFVLGAGASAEVGLPMGGELLKQIVQLTHITFEFHSQKSGDYEIVQALRHHLNEGGDVHKLNEHIKAGWQLKQSAQQALSIDNVIDALEGPRVELIGKLGIARAILSAESASPFFKRPKDHTEGVQLSRFDDTWYSSFTKLLTENVRKSEINDIFNNVEIVNFNYDRCLEHYIPYSLAAYYGVRPEAIRELMQGLIIHRPYGVAGRLPWQKGEAPSVEFGGGTAHQLVEVAQQVRTFTERVEEARQLTAMRNSIASADRVVFLGFAFHRQNVELLAQRMQDRTQIVSTAYGVSKSDKEVIEDELRSAMEFRGALADRRIVLADLTCSQFFQEYWRTLTAERSYDEPIDFPQPLEIPRLSPFK